MTLSKYLRAAGVALLAMLGCGKGDGGTAPVVQPASIAAVSSGLITAEVGTAVTPSPQFVVRDASGNAMPNVTVTVAVGSGGGTLTGAPTKTAASGATSVGTWTLGTTAGPQTLTVTVAGLSAPLVITATATPAFALEVRFFGPTMDPNVQALFTGAAARIQAMISGDVPNVGATALDLSGCPVSVPGVTLNEPIDDIIVYAQVSPIDGLNGILASAGPCFVRTPSGLTIVGVMNFDSADTPTRLADGTLGSVILHEMLHTVGVGTLWATKAQVSASGTPSVAFIGQQAVAGCLFHGGGATNQCGGGTVPVEATGGAGSANVHWRENTSSTGVGLNSELMTPFAEPAGVPMPVSRITIGSLADIGYTVNVQAADSYTVPSTAVASLEMIREGQGFAKYEIRESLSGPIATVDGGGRVTRLTPR